MKDGNERGSRWQSIARIWLMPLWAAATAALGSYFGVIRAINELRAEILVVQTEYRTTMRTVERRLSTLEAELPRDAATQRDLAAVREAAERASQVWVERHEQAYHHQRGRRAE